MTRVSHFHADWIGRVPSFGQVKVLDLVSILDPDSEEGRMNVQAYCTDSSEVRKPRLCNVGP